MIHKIIKHKIERILYSCSKGFIGDKTASVEIFSLLVNPKIDIVDVDYKIIEEIITKEDNNV